MRNLFTDRRGVSLFVGLIFVAALMIVSTTLARTIMYGEVNRARYDRKVQMQYLAESAQEAAQWLATHVLPEGGTESDVNPQVLAAVEGRLLASAAAAGVDVANCDDIDNNPNNGVQKCFDIKIRGRGVNAADFAAGTFRFKNKDLYSVPLKGTGSVTDQCVDANDPDDPCNWNKLYFGDSVEIPLYYIDGSGVAQVPDFSALNQNKAFYLRMRTPCQPNGLTANYDALASAQRKFPNIEETPEALLALGLRPTIEGTDYPRNCNAPERIVLYPASDGSNPHYLTFANDPVIVQWLIKAEGVEELVAGEGADDENILKRPSLTRGVRADFQLNSQLTSGRLNTANNQNAAWWVNNFINLESLDVGILLFTPNDRPTIERHINNNRLKKPKLKLNAITRFRKNQNREQVVPYLEYQLLISGPVAESETKIEVTVNMLGMSAQKTAKIRKDSGADDFVLGNL